jgi:hypothetical protein
MATLAMNRFVANTDATAAAQNANCDIVEAVVNALDADNLAADSVTAVKLNGDVVRADYGLKQHTDGTLQVDVSDTNPALELTDGGVRVKAYGLNQRTANGLEVGRAGDLLLSSAATTPDGWTDVSATYSDKFIRINATALSTGGADTHDHGAATGSHTLTEAEMPAHTHTLTCYDPGTTAAKVGWGGTSNTQSGITNSAGSGGGHTHTLASADNIPAFMTTKMFLKS